MNLIFRLKFQENEINKSRQTKIITKVIHHVQPWSKLIATYKYPIDDWIYRVLKAI
jgi:hypothetical protein